MPDHPHTRRRFLAGAGGLALAGGRGVGRSGAQSPTNPAVARGGRFAQSVASGQPTTNGITLWTKVSELQRPGRMQYEVATDPEFRSVVLRQSVTPNPANDFALTTRVQSARLKPSERYYYRFLTCDTSSPVGRFRTARPADSREPVRIGFWSCQDYESGFYTAHAGLAQEEDLDLVICLGDYVYERHFYDGPPERRDTTGANRDANVQTLPEYRDKYRLYHSDPNLLAMREQHPLLVIWDDHEVEDNYAADRQGDAFTDAERRGVAFAARRAAAYRSYFEHQPRVPVFDDPSRIYGQMGLGANADVFLLDQRQYRDDQPCGDQVGVPCPEADAPGRTFLGPQQKRWLLDGLAGSKARWKIVGNQLMIMSLDLVRGATLSKDSWDGYTAERAELCTFIRDRGIEDVAFVTGDIHTFFAGNVHPTGRGAPVDPPAVATEFVGGSITSKGIADGEGGEQGAGTVAFPLDSGVLTQNPHIKFSNQQFKGYGVLEARPDELLVSFKSPRTTATAKSSLFTLQRFRVAAGTPAVELLGAG